jgi:hypothetical protein
LSGLRNESAHCFEHIFFGRPLAQQGAGSKGRGSLWLQQKHKKTAHGYVRATIGVIHSLNDVFIHHLRNCAKNMLLCGFVFFSFIHEE